MVQPPLGADRNGTAIAICGRIVEDAPDLPIPQIGKIKRILNTRKYFSMLMKNKKACRKLEKLSDEFWIEQKTTAREQYDVIDKKMKVP